VLLVLVVAGGLYVFVQRGRAVSAQATPAISQDTAREKTARDVDPALVTYQSVGELPTGLTKPRGIALSSDDQQVLVVGDQSLRVLDWQGQAVAEVNLGAAPYCLAAGPDNKRYLGFRDHVEVYDPAGQRLAQWQPAGAKSYFTCVTVSGDNILVGDAGQRVVLRYDAAGQVVGLLGQKDPARNIPGIVVPSPHLDVAMGTDGLLRVTNPGRRTVEVYDLDGNLSASWGKSGQAVDGFSGCCNPTDLALLPDGRWLTAEKGIPRVKAYSAAGVFESVVASPSALSATASGMDLAVDSAGRVLVLDPPAKVIRVFAPVTAPTEPAASPAKAGG
jgi:DNA-binding beta-propeller fold protein YncE